MATKIKLVDAEKGDMLPGDPPETGHNLPPDDAVINTKELRQHIGDIEALAADIADIREDMKDKFTLMKGLGYDLKTVKALIRLRAMDPEKRKEAQAILDLYLHALGMD